MPDSVVLADIWQVRKREPRVALPTMANVSRMKFGKYLDHQGSGGNNYESDILKPYALAESEPYAPGQLYNLEADSGETTNLYFVHPEIVEELKEQLDTFRSSGRSIPLRDLASQGMAHNRE